MTTVKISIHSVMLTACLIGFFSNAHAGVWDDPKNLKVLPEDISPGELRSTMTNFARSVGGRCSSCHVGEVERDLRTYDFSLDDKEAKRKARAMYRMVNNINDYIAENVHEDTADPVTVECATCHRGRAKPEMIQDLMSAMYREEGLDKAREEYLALRERYYGGYAFDFSERALNRLAEVMAGENDLDAALDFLDLNLEFYPQSDRAYQLQGDMWKQKGNIPAARNSYQKALEIAPNNSWTQKLIDDLGNDE